MSDNEKMNSKENNNNKFKHRRIMTKQNSPLSLKNPKHLNNTLYSNKNNEKIKLKKASSISKNKKNSNEERHNNTIERINFNSKKKIKNLKSFSPSCIDNNNKENSILLKKLKNIQIQTKFIKDELKKYKRFEKNYGIKQPKKRNNFKALKNIETTRNDNRREISKNKDKKIGITKNNDKRLNTYQSPKKTTNYKDKFKNKNKNIIIDFFYELFNDKNNIYTTINNNSVTGYRFIKYKNNELKKFLSTKSKIQKLNKSAVHRKKSKFLKHFDLSPKNKENKDDSNQSRNKSIIKNIKKYSKKELFSPINKINYLESIIKSDRRKNKAKNYLYRKKGVSRICTNANSYSNIRRENKEKLMNTRGIQNTTSVEKLKKIEKYKNKNKKFHESKVKSLQDISVIYQNLNNNENIEKVISPEKPEEKEIMKIEKLCKKGYSGEGIDKPNQDNYFIYTNFNNDSNNIYMGVCDGHGKYGQDISSFLVTNLPLVLGNFLRIFNIRDISLSETQTLLPIVSNSFKQVNKNLFLEQSFDCNLSGSTCVSLIYTRKKVFCINIGDSRCIVGKFDGYNWKSESLSIDHKPSLEKEKERILNNGGEIRQSKDDNGEFIGPQRVWVKNTDVPGLAMSRSFGDEVAHQIGVVCEPEIFEYELHQEDKFIILASDGLWEFMTNQEVIDIVKDYYISENYKGATKHLYKESCKKWLDEEGAIDDITIIVVFFK